MNGLSATILVTIKDDNILDETADDDIQKVLVETIILSIYYEEDAGFEYITGRRTTHTIYVYDNDAIWDGTFTNNNASLHFKMKIIRDASGISGSLLTDGAGIIPSGTRTTTIDGEELSEWPISVSTASAGTSTFKATVEGMEVPGTSTHFNTGIKRSFQFNANTDNDGHAVDWKSSITGNVTEKISFPEKAYLDRTVNGTFTVLMRIPSVEVKKPTLTSTSTSK